MVDRGKVEGAGQWFGRTVAERVAEAVSGRFETDRRSSVEIAGGLPVRNKKTTAAYGKRLFSGVEGIFCKRRRIR